MRIDREFYAKFEDVVRTNDFIAASVEAGQWDRVIDYVNQEVFDKPTGHYSLEKLRKAAGVDRRLTLREILEKIFGLIPRFKSKDELLEGEFSKFVADRRSEEAEANPRHQDLLQGLRHKRRHPPHHRVRGTHRPRHQPRVLHPGFQGRPREIPHPHPGIHQGLRQPEPLRRVNAEARSQSRRLSSR